MDNFNCLPDRSPATLKRITGTDDPAVHQELTDMADFVNEADQFAHVRGHSADLLFTSYTNGALHFTIGGTGCKTCSGIMLGNQSLADLKTISPLKRLMNEFFGIPTNKIHATVLADAPGAKPNFKTFTPA